MLEAMGALIAVNDQAHVLDALLLLRRGIHQHRSQLNHCVGELLAVVTACLGSYDNAVAFSAVAAAEELVKVFQDELLQHMTAQGISNASLLLRLLVLCSGNTSAQAPTRPGQLRSVAEKAMHTIATTLHQPSVVKLLEPLASGHVSAVVVSKEMKAMASSVLLIATYRLS